MRWSSRFPRSLNALLMSLAVCACAPPSQADILESCRAGDALDCFTVAAQLIAAQNYEEALEPLRVACDGAEPRACNDLGRFQLYGLGGLPADPPRAAALFGRAGEGGAQRGCVNLGRLHAEGRGV